MDFKSLLNKLDSMEAPAKGIAAPELPKAVQLDEGAQLRVLSGQSTILAESAIMEKAAKKEVSAAEEKEAKDKKEAQKKKIAKIVDEASAKKMAKKEKEVDESIEGDLEEGWDEMEADIKKKADEKKGTGKFDKKQTSTGTQYTRKSNTFTDGGDDSDVKAAKKKAKKDESIEEGRVAQLPTRGADYSKYDTDHLKMMLRPGILHRDEARFKALIRKELQKREQQGVAEGAKPDFLDMDKDGDKKEPMKKAVADKKGGKPQKGVNPFAKKAVKESVEGKLTFAKALQLIKESNGTAQIDPLDDHLWSWARRVAASKFNESVKADVYAATTYERMGGTWAIAQLNE